MQCALMQSHAASCTNSCIVLAIHGNHVALQREAPLSVASLAKLWENAELSEEGVRDTNVAEPVRNAE